MQGVSDNLSFISFEIRFQWSKTAGVIFVVTTNGVATDVSFTASGSGNKKLNKISSLLSENAQCGEKGKHHWRVSRRNTREK